MALGRGHYSVVMTERYAHLRPELFTGADLATIRVDLKPGKVAALPAGQANRNGAKKREASRARTHGGVAKPGALGLETVQLGKITIGGT